MSKYDGVINGNGSNKTEDKPRILIIGAGSRGNAYARAIHQSGIGVVAAVADPIPLKRRLLGSKYIWGHDHEPSIEQEFDGWQQFVTWERQRRNAPYCDRLPGVDAVFICVLDEQHADVVTALAPFKLHIMCEKPLATSLQDCLRIYSTLLLPHPQVGPETVFGIGHVLRYSPHNMLLRQLVLEDDAVGDVLSIEHTEPVGWWHFSHSYVRGNWRRESTTAPSLLTKSCHDIDFLLWMLCSPPRGAYRTAHLPSHISSTGSLKSFRRSRKPAAAGDATNCLSCPIQESCMYSAPKIYYDKHLAKGNTDWPVSIVNPEIESCFQLRGLGEAKTMLLATLSEDYNVKTSQEERAGRPWFGRCVWESDNDVCDDQFVTITWEDECIDSLVKHDSPARGKGAKTATFHMIAGTEKQCERRGRIYGTKGEIEYDGTTIRVYDFATDSAQTYNPPRRGGGHGGGDDGLALQFLKAVQAVRDGKMTAEQAQREHIGCTHEEIIRSHALVFAAEEARKGMKVVRWQEWWEVNVEIPLRQSATPSNLSDT